MGSAAESPARWRAFGGALVAVALALALNPGAASAAQLRAGVAEVDITPPNGAGTLGYVRPDISVVGVHTRLTGRVLVLDDGNTEVALLATDLGFALDKDSVVARVSDLGFTHETVLYTGTHTHSGPTELADWQLEQLALAIRRAHEARVPVRAGWGSAEVTDVSRNRSVEAHLANHGMDLAYGQGRPTDDPKGADHMRDTTLRVLRVERTDGTPLAAWLNFPVHLTTTTPAVNVWDADLAGTTTEHMRDRIASPGFVSLYSNGASGDLMPRFNSFNALALIDHHGRRVARQAQLAWNEAGSSLSGQVPVGVRWTRACYCGQEVAPGMRVSSEPVWGLPFLGGSEDGASIFHEPASTEGRRLPAALADPVHGRKIIAAPGLVHETNPEFHVIQIGDRLLLGAPGEPSVEMARRFQRVVRPQLPPGVTDPFVVGLSNDYMGYFTTPEEYEMQHYEGGHTVYGTATSLLALDVFAELTATLSSSQPSPAPSQPPALGSTEAGEPAVGDGGVDGELVSGPPRHLRRMSTFEIAWQGAADGVDRPLGEPFIVLERRVRGAWRAQDSDLGIAFMWRERDGLYTARYELAPGMPLGRYRLRVHSGSYELVTNRFRIGRSRELRVLGVLLIGRGDRERLVVRAQNPAPDPTASVIWRPQFPRGGRALLRVAGQTVRARYSAADGGWVANAPRSVDEGDRIRVLSLTDRAGNRSVPATVKVGELKRLRWPPNMGVGGGRTPGPWGEGDFPP